LPLLQGHVSTFKCHDATASSYLPAAAADYWGLADLAAAAAVAEVVAAAVVAAVVTRQQSLWCAKLKK